MANESDKPVAPASRRDSVQEQRQYFEWDSCKWGTHRVNCYPGSCPFKVYAKDGKVIREEISCSYPEFDDPENRVPDYNPRGCQKGYQHSRAMYGPDRVLHPMKRAGERGSGKWEKISWEQAFEEIGDKIAGVIQKYGPKALIDDHAANGIGVFRGAAEGSTTGMTSLLGGVSFDLDFVTGDFKVGQWLTFGEMHHAPGIENWFLPDTIILMSNPVYANIPDIHYILEARYRGAKIIAVAPDKNPSCQFADIWVPIDWSADPALWLGVAKILIDKGWIDEHFVKEQTDLPILVRSDDGRFLAESHLREGGDPEQFYAIDSATGQPVQMPKGTLEMAADYALDTRTSVRLKDGTKLDVRSVFSLLKERLLGYTPEKVHEMSGGSPGYAPADRRAMPAAPQNFRLYQLHYRQALSRRSARALVLLHPCADRQRRQTGHRHPGLVAGNGDLGLDGGCLRNAEAGDRIREPDRRGRDLDPADDGGLQDPP